MPGFPTGQRLLVILQQHLVDVEDAVRAARAAAILERRFDGRQRARVGVGCGGWDGIGHARSIPIRVAKVEAPRPGGQPFNS
jgi:hypothetical protein